MEIASLIVSIIACILTIPGSIAYFEAKSKEKEKFKHALGNTKNRQLFNKFISRADGNIKLFKSTLDAYNYCNKHLSPTVQYFTDKEKELSEHPEWFEKTTKAFVIRNCFFKKPYKKIILNAIAEDDNDCKDHYNCMVENAKKSPGKISIAVSI